MTQNPLAELDAWWAPRFQDDEDSETILLRYTEQDEAIRIEFATVGGEDTAYLERAEWRLDIEGVEEAVWNWEYGEPAWFEEHPLLIPYNSVGALISFAQPFKDPLRALGAATRAHQTVVEGWFPLERFLRTGLFDDRFGELALGPDKLLSIYADALLSAGESVGYTRIAEWSPKEAPPYVITWGKSYFVARSFLLERLG